MASPFGDPMAIDHIHLEHDGKLLLVDQDGNGPVKPVMGRVHSEALPLLRLPSPNEASSMGISWNVRRVNRIRLGEEEHVITYATPEISWPVEWAWKDSVISDSAVDPVARESVYRTLHRVVSKVIIRNPNGELLMAKVARGFFTGCWTLPGGFVDYSEHPRDAAVREALEELGIEIEIPDSQGESGPVVAGDDSDLIQCAIFNEEGINWLSFTYRSEADLPLSDIKPKDDEIEEARWFSKEEALKKAVSIFDIEAIMRLD